MAFPPFPSNGETNWGNKMQTWSDAVEGEAGKLKVSTSAGTRVYVTHPGGTTTIHYDSGWRELKDTLINGWTAGSVIIRRVNNTIYSYLRALDGSEATSTNFMILPGGFHRSAYTPFVVDGKQFRVEYSGDYHSNSAYNSLYIGASLFWLPSSNPLPQILPGEPSTAG